MEWLAYSWGLKPGLRLRLPPAQAARKREEARELGSATAEAADRGATILYVAATRAAAEALREAEAPLLAGDAAASIRRAAHLALGRGLGYPRCCAEAYAERLDARPMEAETHEDFLFASAALEASDTLHARLNFLRRGEHRYLIPFYPCAFDCAWALRYATGTLRGIETRGRPGDAARLLEGLTERLWLGRDGVPRASSDEASPGALALCFDAP